MKNVIWGSIYLSLAASIWGGLFVVVKVATVVIPPLQLVWLRYMTALVALLFIGWQRGISWEISRRHWKTVFLIGLIGCLCLGFLVCRSVYRFFFVLCPASVSYGFVLWLLGGFLRSVRF